MRKKSLLLLIGILIMVVITTACGKSKPAIMRAADWEKKHPDVFATYLANSDMSRTTYGGSEPIDYLEKYPNLKVFYDGYGFSKEYLRARGIFMV